MPSKKVCRECGSITVSEAPERLCFSCQIEKSAAAGEGETFFFDEADASSRYDGLQERVDAALESIRVTGELGRGGMGVVYRGMQTRLEREVAVKVMPPLSDLGGGFSARFLAEARAMARLHHPGIVTIHDFGQTTCGLSYIVMEYLDGGSLRDQLREGPLEPTRALEIVGDVADALAYAHGLDVVHRDMKPENILLDGRGPAKIADFGIAKLEGQRHVARLTKTHQVLGTPLYMAPEQAVSARGVDHRADLYAMGVILYEALTGDLPGAELRPPARLVRLDARVDPLVVSLLEKERSRRAGDAAALAEACRELARSWGSRKRAGVLGWMFGGRRSGAGGG